MKPTIPLVACIVVALLALGCKRSERPNRVNYNVLDGSQSDSVDNPDDGGNVISSTGTTNNKGKKARRRRKGKQNGQGSTGIATGQGSHENIGETDASSANPFREDAASGSGSATHHKEGESFELGEFVSSSKSTDNVDGDGAGANGQGKGKGKKSKGKGKGKTKGNDNDNRGGSRAKDFGTGSGDSFTDEKNCGIQKFKDSALSQNPTTLLNQDGKAGHPWTWHVRLVYTDAETKGKTMCAAFFIKAKDDEEKSDMIGTLASCITEFKSGRTKGSIDYLNRDNFWVILGSNRMRPSAPDETVDHVEKRLRIADWLKHDGYKGVLTENNVAVARVEEAVDISNYKYIAPICRPTEGSPDPTERDYCIIVGWPNGGPIKRKPIPLKHLQMSIQEGGKSESNKDVILAEATNSDPDQASQLLDNNIGTALVCFKPGSWVINGFLVPDLIGKFGKLSPFMRYRSYAGWIKDEADKMSKVDQPVIQAPADLKTDTSKKPTDTGRMKGEQSAEPDFIDPDDTTLYDMAWAIWEADEQERAKINIDFKISWGPTLVIDHDLKDPDVWPPDFFTWVNLDKLLKFPIYNATWELLEAHDGDDIELQEQRAKDFFEVFSQSAPYRALRKTLKENGLKLARNPAEFNKVVRSLLIGRYQTSPDRPTEVFYTHYCIGELGVFSKTGKETAMGIHHWLCLFFHQYKDRLHFVGHIKDRQNFIPSLRYRIGETYWKQSGTVFLGSTFAYDLAVIILAYFTRNNREAKFFLPDCTPVTITARDYDMDGQKFLFKGFPSMFDPIPNKDICPEYAKFKHPDQETLFRMGQELWEADQGARAEIGADFKVNLGQWIDRKYKPGTHPDSPEKLFTWVNTDALFRRSPTYFALWELLKAYTGRDLDSIKNKEKQFFNAVKKTKPYRMLKGQLTKAEYAITKWNDADYDTYMTNLWTKLYKPKGAKTETSYCEYYFFGETGPTTLKGLYYWLSIHYRENFGEPRLNHTGYQNKRFELFPTIQFRIGKAVAEAVSILMGASPEFQISLVTLSSFTRQDDKALFWLGESACIPTYVKASQYDVYGDKCLLKGYMGTLKPAEMKVARREQRRDFEATCQSVVDDNYNREN